jgi:hypothetical protein
MVTAHTRSLAGLSPGTLVHFRVRARDAAGNLALAGDRMFTSSAPDDPAIGMVAHWPLDEIDGTVADDATGSNHLGTLLNTPTHVGGHDGAAVSFNGVNESGTVASTADLDAFPLSLSLWVKTTATGTAGVVNKYLASSMSGYQVFVSGGSVCAWYFRDATDYVWDGTACGLQAPGINDGSWHHVALVVDAAGGRMYVDGVLRGSRVWTGTPGPTATTQPLSFASYPGSTTPFLAGALDDVRLYGRTLTPTEVTAIYQAPGAPDPTTLNLSAIRAYARSSTQVDVSWDTTQPSDAQVEFGLTTSYGSTTTTDPLMLTQHVQPLSDLLASSIYHYRVRSRNARGEVMVSADMTFKTPRRGSYSTLGTTKSRTGTRSDTTAIARNKPLLGGGS